jgi:hypothetical protein
MSKKRIMWRNREHFDKLSDRRQLALSYDSNGTMNVNVALENWRIVSLCGNGVQHKLYYKKDGL